MAGKQTETTETPREPNMADLMAMFAQTMAQQTAVLGKLGENTKPYEPAFGDPAYQERLRAEGHFDTFPLPVYQNGREAEAKGLSAEIRERASGLRAGTYLKTKVKDGVTVERTDKMVHLKYRSQKIEDRMAQPWRNFEELVTMVWDEMHAA